MEEQLRARVLDELKEVVNQHVTGDGVCVYLFGSWARKQEKQSSDIDLAIKYDGSKPPFDWMELVDRIEESTVPYNVDVVDMNVVSEEVLKEIEEEGIMWKGCKKD